MRISSDRIAPPSGCIAMLLHRDRRETMTRHNRLVKMRSTGAWGRRAARRPSHPSRCGLRAGSAVCRLESLSDNSQGGAGRVTPEPVKLNFIDV